MTISEYRRAWKAHILFDMWPPLPTVYEKCDCGRKIYRRITWAITCNRCKHTVRSYNNILSKKGELR